MHKSSVTYSMIILNSESIKSTMLMGLWDKCKTRVCADGGSNRLYDSLSLNSQELLSNYIPDYITGDLDSLRKDTEDYYRLLIISIYLLYF